MTDEIIWYDFADARPDPAALKAAGAAGVIRYGCPYADPKRASLPELQGYRAVGLDERLVFETTATRLLTGAAGGQVDGPWFEAWADSLGYPANYPLYYAADFNCGPAQFAAVEAYLRAARGKRPVGCYGPAGLLGALRAAGAVDCTWQAGAATSWYGNAKLDAACHFYQRATPAHPLPAGVAPGQVDENVQMHPDIVVGPAQPTDPTEVTMPLSPADISEIQLMLRQEFVPGAELYDRIVGACLQAVGEAASTTIANACTQAITQSAGGIVADVAAALAQEVLVPQPKTPTAPSTPPSTPPVTGS